MSTFYIRIQEAIIEFAQHEGTAPNTILLGLKEQTEFRGWIYRLEQEFYLKHTSINTHGKRLVDGCVVLDVANPSLLKAAKIHWP